MPSPPHHTPCILSVHFSPGRICPLHDSCPPVLHGRVIKTHFWHKLSLGETAQACITNNTFPEVAGLQPIYLCIRSQLYNVNQSSYKRRLSGAIAATTTECVCAVTLITHTGGASLVCVCGIKRKAYWTCYNPSACTPHHQPACVRPLSALHRSEWAL